MLDALLTSTNCAHFFHEPQGNGGSRFQVRWMNTIVLREETRETSRYTRKGCSAALLSPSQRTNMNRSLIAARSGKRLHQKMVEKGIRQAHSMYRVDQSSSNVTWQTQSQMSWSRSRSTSWTPAIFVTNHSLPFSTEMP